MWRSSLDVPCVCVYGTFRDATNGACRAFISAFDRGRVCWHHSIDMPPRARKPSHREWPTTFVVAAFAMSSFALAIDTYVHDIIDVPNAVPSDRVLAFLIQSRWRACFINMVSAFVCVYAMLRVLNPWRMPSEQASPVEPKAPRWYFVAAFTTIWGHLLIVSHTCFASVYLLQQGVFYAAFGSVVCRIAGMVLMFRAMAACQPSRD